MKIFYALFLSAAIGFASNAQSPEITSWIINTTGATGFNGIESNVQQVQYSAANVYISCSSVPSYNIGPWNQNPNTPQDQNFVYKITRNPQPNSGTPVNTPLGHIGVWTNGVSIFNAKDAFSYNNGGVWNQNAIFNEAVSFDECLGHPNQTGEYHHHLNPTCLYDDHDSSQHSPIIGFAFDGYPIYGAYGYADPNGAGQVTRMRSSYRLRNITDRTTLPDGSTASQTGPSINGNPLGKYIEDFEFVQGLGHLDIHNGRQCITPEYPQGTYAYFVTLDANLTAAYPYTLGPTYYGTVPPGNTGPNSGHNAINEEVTTYFVGIEDVQNDIQFSVYPNPASEFIALFVSPSFNNNLTADIYNATGQRVASQRNIQPATQYLFDLSSFTGGVYSIQLTSADRTTVKRFVKTTQ